MSAPARKDLDAAIDQIASEIVAYLAPGTVTNAPGFDLGEAVGRLSAAGSFLLTYRSEVDHYAALAAEPGHKNAAFDEIAPFAPAHVEIGGAK